MCDMYLHYYVTSQVGSKARFPIFLELHHDCWLCWLSLFSRAQGDWGFATLKQLHIYPLEMDQLILTRKLFECGSQVSITRSLVRYNSLQRLIMQNIRPVDYIMLLDGEYFRFLVFCCFSSPVQSFAFVSDPKIHSYSITVSLIELKLYERSQTALIVTPVQYYINWPVLSRFSPKEFMKTGKRTPRALVNPIVRITHKVVSPQINHDHRLSCLNETIIPLKKFIVIPISDQKALVSSARLPLMCHHKGPSQMGYPTAKTFTYNNSTGRILLRLDLL